ncbi:methyl-accepting chemotaxis protein [Massilia antarctica]|uniref:methyl-accepting chemotaxis protein n=1 Tax=Massilia antarctica TaxID=2765360 RepID=UPI0006BB7BF5|nr:methyl-accepting chemotaxis protein [Massilia sp. H27-R4]MCY0914637.1 methyl-accepting chemotaxis protein [Massilia sp. H27-R4]CUI08337.1 Methyl-accepting chemotaxis protein I (serine chemoreceptor protein) [Janthinobacterium sp. CG23_2]CUU32123.1 Methyl-accepting chemotaxis protein I (serine chemoreceptor protein) [Janthinobacterium sp. CG23_2]
MFTDLSIKNKLFLGFGAIVAIILFLLILAYNNFSKMSEASRWDRHTLEVLLETNKIATNVLEIQAEVRGYLLTGEERFLTPQIDEEKSLLENVQRALRLTADNPVQNARIRKLDDMTATWLKTVIQPMLAKRRALGKVADSAEQITRWPELNNGFQTVGDVRALIAQIADEENALLTARTAASAQLQQTMSLLLSLGGAVCVALASVVAWMLARALLNPLNNLTEAVGKIAAGQQSARAAVLSGDELGKVTEEFNRMAQSIQDSQANETAATNALRANVDALLDVVSKAAIGDLTGTVTITGSDAIGRMGEGLKTMVGNLRILLNNVQKAGIQVTTSATEIAASAKEQEATGIEQAQTSIEILSTTKEISANTTQLLKTMEDATAVADYTTSATAEAQQNLKRMDSTMQHMVSATDSINAKLAALSEKASNINSVLITITKVADQTNILSLNAAIEAEKAGDAGRGFSVVATEIRRLADQTSVSTWDIEQMLKEMQSAVSASVMGMDKFSEEIRRSVGEVRQVGEQLSTVMDQVQKLAPQFDLVLQGMQSQAVGAAQISDTMMQLNDATQQTVESLKATSEAVHQLQYAASDLQSSVATFSVNA